MLLTKPGPVESPAFTKAKTRVVLLRDGNLLINVGGEGLLRVSGGLWKAGATVGRVDGTKTGRVPTVFRSIITWRLLFRTQYHGVLWAGFFCSRVPQPPDKLLLCSLFLHFFLISHLETHSNECFSLCEKPSPKIVQILTKFSSPY